MSNEDNAEKIDLKYSENNKSLNNSKNIKSLLDTSTSILIDKETTNFDLYKGLLFMLISCILKSLFSLGSKLLLERSELLNSFIILLLKAYIMVLISVVFIVVLYYTSPEKLFPKSDALIKVAIRATLSICSLSIIIFSLKILAISEVFSIYYAYPGIVLILSIIFLKEKAGKMDYFCLFACFCGVLLLIRPEFISKLFNVPASNVAHKVSINHKADNEEFYVPKIILLLLVLLAAIFKATEDIIIKKVGKGVSPILYPIVYSFIGLLLYAIPIVVFKVHIDPILHLGLIDWGFLLAIAICSYGMQFFMALAFQGEYASRASMVNYLQLVFMLLSDVFIFHKTFYYIDIIGTFMIFGFNLANGIYKFCSRLSRKEEKNRKEA